MPRMWPGRRSYLRRFIHGRSELVKIMKGEKDEPWSWSDEREVAFQAIKYAIANNAMAPADDKFQYHLACDSSKQATGTVLFQSPGNAPNTESTCSAEHREVERTIMFMSFKLQAAQRNYSNSKREALAVMRALAEVRWLVVASP
ncbi:Similar to Transposon Ty3-I Gag-Pol polyprotein; acc. no. Q7LHG5 [Pyronema omphalodes CBS 100304]|uniref:Similar to Transposon Ty3-I Gag-Pol polyprotein acc. no. Q7LHG5 n=1 Tax=Pyronema omphalodes (strain CBS 100304) TaxID=1076935 RepID=U4L3H3_PYROM|nr:Similar to Transposon Ty3-I Gag-Pol polyprotein; acc. no. Q7LHG5 [Pyronema omphalodes CBS 100304]